MDGWICIQTIGLRWQSSQLTVFNGRSMCFVEALHSRMEDLGHLKIKMWKAAHGWLPGQSRSIELRRKEARKPRLFWSALNFIG